MSKQIELLDCTLRDGSYITGSEFGAAAIKGIIKKMQDAHIEVIECGWLKDKEYKEGTTYFHVPSDLEKYLIDKQEDAVYVAMIDWDRYDTSALPPYDGKSIDAIRVVFPHGKHKEGMEVGKKIREKGYKVYLQAANTLSYSNEDLYDLAQCINEFKPVAVSIVDTFGAMYPEDLERISTVLDAYVDRDIKLGFHSHNNQQLSFALSIKFVELMKKFGRCGIVDASLCGMGRGAGNTTTELITSYLNKKEHGDYDMNAVLDAIDMYMEEFKEKFEWGYSTPYFIAGMYQTHVNNVAYLLKNHRTNSRDMRNIFASLSTEERRHYDYDLLENKYLENQGRIVDDAAAIEDLKNRFADRKILLLAPGKSIIEEEAKIKQFIAENDPVVIGVNAYCDKYDYDYLFFTNSVRYEYAKEVYGDKLEGISKILLSNITSEPSEGAAVINFNSVIKRGWEHFDNAMILALRLTGRIKLPEVNVAGFDGFKTSYNESYADLSLPTLNPDGKWDELNEEIKDMFTDYKASVDGKQKINFLTESYFNE